MANRSKPKDTSEKDFLLSVIDVSSTTTEVTIVKLMRTDYRHLMISH